MKTISNLIIVTVLVVGLIGCAATAVTTPDHATNPYSGYDFGTHKPGQ